MPSSLRNIRMVEETCFLSSIKFPSLQFSKGKTLCKLCVNFTVCLKYQVLLLNYTLSQFVSFLSYVNMAYPMYSMIYYPS